MSVPLPTKFAPTAAEARRVNLCSYSVGIFRIYAGINFPATFNPVRPNAKNLSQAASKNFGEYSHGHEHVIDHPRRDIFVRRVWLLWARALVLNGRHGVRDRPSFLKDIQRWSNRPLRSW
jgi:hypothetical protein